MKSPDAGVSYTTWVSLGPVRSVDAVTRLDVCLSEVLLLVDLITLFTGACVRVGLLVDVADLVAVRATDGVAVRVAGRADRDGVLLGVRVGGTGDGDGVVVIEAVAVAGAAVGEGVIVAVAVGGGTVSVAVLVSVGVSLAGTGDSVGVEVSAGVAVAVEVGSGAGTAPTKGAQ